MDELDRSILIELQKDARVPFRKIAEANGISIGTVHNRLKKLKKEGVLKGFIPVLDATKLGYMIIAIVYIRVEGGHMEEIKRQILDDEMFPEINVVYNTSGNYDLILIVRFKNMFDLADFNKKIAKIPFMKHETNVVLGVLKDEYNIKL